MITMNLNIVVVSSIAAIASPTNSSLVGRYLNGNRTVGVRAIDEANLRFNGPERDSGREALRAVKFPAGDWVNVQLTLTVESRATPGRCSYPNPTGDIYDRSASVFLVQDEGCIDGSSCIGSPGQIELLKAITPFGTDTRTGPRSYTFDITPLAPLLVGAKFVGAWIDTYDSNGWWVYVDFTFIADPLQASPKPPAAGITPVFFKTRVTSAAQPEIQPVTLTVPDFASQVFLRLFTTGHGAVGSPPCDEFCRRNNQVLVDGKPVWEHVVWNHCNLIPDACRAWNACGFPSCRFDRSGWCPGNIACQDDQPCDQDVDVTASLPPGETHDVLFHVDNITPGGAYWNYSLLLYWY